MTLTPEIEAKLKSFWLPNNRPLPTDYCDKELQRLANYLNSRGYYFASNPEQEWFAEIACTEKTLQRADKLENLTDQEKRKLKYFYVHPTIKSKEELAYCNLLKYLNL